MSARSMHLLYSAKQLMPRTMEIKLRWLRAQMIAAASREVWPINEAAAGAPFAWQGWPNKKKFALVLTHDVEWARGLDKCLDLCQVEESLGFRSAFYFVPHRYCTPAALREDLVARGFEVGVHGLKHDGRLFFSKKIFSERARLINDYLREWDACGFRSPAMHHNLDWLRELNILYDASTFDTDPFQPQPDCLQRIFPLWIPPYEDRPGYVELPYTLPQDWKLFVILRKENNEIWKRKLDWIAERGGMALILSHPDYMRIGDESLKGWDYPAEYYVSLLRYIVEKYQGQYWHALPREMAKFWSKLPDKGHDYDAWANARANGAPAFLKAAGRMKPPLT